MEKSQRDLIEEANKILSTNKKEKDRYIPVLPKDKHGRVLTKEERKELGYHQCSECKDWFQGKSTTTHVQAPEGSKKNSHLVKGYFCPICAKKLLNRKPKKKKKEKRKSIFLFA